MALVAFDLWYVFDLAYLVVPLLLTAATRARTGLVVALGVVAIAVEWGLAAAQGSEDLRGTAGIAVTGLFAVGYFGGAWAVGMLCGAVVRRLRRRPRLPSGQARSGSEPERPLSG